MRLDEIPVRLGQQKEQVVTILFSDIRNFTKLCEGFHPQESFSFLNSYLSQMEPVISAHCGLIDKFIGDSIMVTFHGAADDAVACAIDMLSRLAQYNESLLRDGYAPIDIGIGINTGIVALGVIGGESRMGSTVIGDPVNLASRLERMNKLYGTSILISDYTASCLKGNWSLRLIDATMIKGKGEPQLVYEVFDQLRDKPRPSDLVA